MGEKLNKSEVVHDIEKGMLENIRPLVEATGVDSELLKNMFVSRDSDMYVLVSAWGPTQMLYLKADEDGITFGTCGLDEYKAEFPSITDLEFDQKEPIFIELEKVDGYLESYKKLKKYQTYLEEEVLPETQNLLRGCGILNRFSLEEVQSLSISNEIKGVTIYSIKGAINSYDILFKCDIWYDSEKNIFTGIFRRFNPFYPEREIESANMFEIEAKQGKDFLESLGFKEGDN